MAPYPIEWNTGDPRVWRKWIRFAQVVRATAPDVGIALGPGAGLPWLRWGGDWDSDWDGVSDPTADVDQRFNDWPHWEIRF